MNPPKEFPINMHSLIFSFIITLFMDSSISLSISTRERFELTLLNPWPGRSIAIIRLHSNYETLKKFI
jgi:hypothetical protein